LNSIIACRHTEPVAADHTSRPAQAKICDRTRRRGRRGGRPAAVDAEKLAAVIAALDAGATKAAACRTFGIKRSTLIDSLARVGWSAGIKVQEA
jgi:DNA invertase Pin-like site-specific DNA recombinase